MNWFDFLCVSIGPGTLVILGSLVVLLVIRLMDSSGDKP